MNCIKKLDKVTKNDVGIAGGKGASLGEMIQAGFTVPDGFVITTNAYEKYKQEGSKDIPEEVTKEIMSAFEKLGAEKVAVRSSAKAEDSASDAWAGQLESYLNTTKENLLENVQKCWDSLSSLRAVAYAHEKGLDEKEISVAVVVQKMIQSDIAGVAFSVHPVSGDTNRIIIEAVEGLGDKLVSGEVTPDSYVVSKDTKKIIENKGEHLLHDDQVSRLAEIILNIEKHYGFPVDVEWAYADGKFWIVQSRPITTLSDISDIEKKLNALHIVPMGKRRTNMFQAILKTVGWSTGLKKELGMGYIAIVINSHGEQFADQESMRKLRAVIQEKDFLFAQQYVVKMSDLNASLLEKVSEKIDTDYVQEFSALFAYFFIAKQVFEFIYEKSTDEEKKYIEEWRNDSTLFSSLDLYYEKNPQNDPDEAWSQIAFEGESYFIHKDLHFRATSHSENENGIKGSVAYPGVIRGKVRLILTHADKSLLQEGEIIVAPMTTVDFMPIMKKAVAFVTDEGGITSHAAIVAREMKKPCIIGTKIATKILKTGDMVEVDADNGVVRILK